MTWTCPSPAWIVPSRVAENTHSMKPAASVRATRPKVIAEMPNRLRRYWRVTLRNALRNSSHASRTFLFLNRHHVSRQVPRQITNRSKQRPPPILIYYDITAIRSPQLNPGERKTSSDFDYENAFSRNIGWLTKTEQAALRGKRVAIAGLACVGGAHLLTLTRLGVGAFHIADFDTFDVPNFNRQAGAMTSTLGRTKTEVLSAMARDINPGVQLTVFDKGVTEQNIDAFLDGIDL